MESLVSTVILLGRFLKSRLMMRVLFLLWIGGAVLTAHSAPAFSQGLHEPSYSVRGFGTLGGAYHSGGEAGFRRDITQPKGARNSFTTDIDSRIGLQLDAAWHRQFGATLQVISRYGYDGTYRPELTWGFLRYRPQPDLEIRAGRLGWDVYLMSDSRDVGYSSLWVRPPVEYYGHLQLSKITGVDAVWRRPAGEAVWSHKLFAGEVSSRIPLDSRSYSNLSGSWLFGGYVDYQRAGWVVRVGLTRLELKTELRGDARRQLDSLRDQGSGLDELVRLTELDTTFHFGTVGVAYDHGPLQAQLMYSYTDSSEDVHSNIHAGYFSLGYRMGRWTPYLMVAAVEAEGNTTAAVPAAAELPGFADTFGSMTHLNQHTVSLGARYDWSSRVALKIQADRVTVRGESGSSLLWSKPDDGWNGRATVLSMTVDFTF